MAKKFQFHHWSRSGLALLILGMLLLLTALIAKTFIGEVTWVNRSAQSGLLLLGIGGLVTVVPHKTGRTAYRYGLVLAVAATLLLGWVNAAVGIVGAADNQFNQLYFVVLAAGFLGAIGVRLKPTGMTYVLLFMALLQTAIAVVALFKKPGGPANSPVEIAALNGFFVAMFVGAAVLFAKAGEQRAEQNRSSVQA